MVIEPSEPIVIALPSANLYVPGTGFPLASVVIPLPLSPLIVFVALPEELGNPLVLGFVPVVPLDGVVVDPCVGVVPPIPSNFPIDERTPLEEPVVPVVAGVLGVETPSNPPKPPVTPKPVNKLFTPATEPPKAEAKVPAKFSGESCVWLVTVDGALIPATILPKPLAANNGSACCAWPNVVSDVTPCEPTLPKPVAAVTPVCWFCSAACIWAVLRVANASALALSTAV